MGRMAMMVVPHVLQSVVCCSLTQRTRSLSGTVLGP
jgi:hypothetical protein